MADYKVIDAEQLDADLTIVADAIRTKGGTTEQLDFPSGFKSAVEAIESGGDNSLAISIIDGSITDLVIPIEVINVRSQAFREANSLKSVHIHNKLQNIGGNAFYNCKELESITWDEPVDDKHRLNGYAFQNCTSLKEIGFPDNIYGIDGYCFSGCTGLEKVKFKYWPWNGMNANTFNGCTNLLDIYVPWTEGEKPNAPWGATNATIHYNTVYDDNYNPIV